MTAQETPRIVRVRATGIVRKVETREGYELTIYGSREEALSDGVDEREVEITFEPDPTGCDFEITLPPTGGWLWRCFSTTCKGKCHVFTRKAGEDWHDQGETWLEKDVFPGFSRCGCLPQA